MIVFDDMIADMLSNEKFYSLVIEPFIRGRKLNISLVFIAQSSFAVPKNIRINSTHYFIMKIPNKQKLYFKDFNFKDFMNLHTKCTVKPYSFLAIDSTLASVNLYV